MTSACSDTQIIGKPRLISFARYSPAIVAKLGLRKCFTAGECWAGALALLARIPGEDYCGTPVQSICTSHKSIQIAKGDKASPAFLFCFAQNKW